MTREKLRGRTSESILSAPIVRSPGIVLTGAGSSAAFGMEDMSSFYENLDSGVMQYVKAVAESNGGNKDLELVLKKLRDHERFLRSWSEDRFLHGFVRFTRLYETQLTGDFQHVKPDYHIEQIRKYRKEIFDEIFHRYGALSRDEKKTAKEIYDEFVIELCGKVAEVHGYCLPFFTTNYDLFFENVFGDHPQIDLVSGFTDTVTDRRFSARVYTSRARTHKKPQNLIPVFRLHGCTHWARDQADPQRITWQSHPLRDHPNLDEVVIYPEAAKEDGVAQPPYNLAYDYFETCLQHASVCLILGNSGRDEAVCQRIRVALSKNQEIQFIVVGKGDPPESFVELIPKERFSYIGDGVEAATSSIVEKFSSFLPSKTNRLSR